MEIGSQVPGFCLPDKVGEQRCLSDFRGKWGVCYFYPRDNTSGCTREAVDFSEQLPDFEKYDAAVIGISPDSPCEPSKIRRKASASRITPKRRTPRGHRQIWRLETQTFVREGVLRCRTQHLSHKPGREASPGMEKSQSERPRRSCQTNPRSAQTIKTTSTSQICMR